MLNRLVRHKSMYMPFFIKVRLLFICLDKLCTYTYPPSLQIKVSTDSCLSVDSRMPLLRHGGGRRRQRL